MPAFRRFCLRKGPASASPGVASRGSYAVDTTYYGSEMEDVEVYDGIGYFASDVNGSNGAHRRRYCRSFDSVRSDHAEPRRHVGLPVGNPGVSRTARFIRSRSSASTRTRRPNTRFMYTSDNESTVVKIYRCHEPIKPATDHEFESRTGIGDRLARSYRPQQSAVCCEQESGFHEQRMVGFTSMTFRTRPARCSLRRFCRARVMHTAMPTDDGKIAHRRGRAVAMVT